MLCAGNSDEHCCWVAGAPCPYLEERTVEGRRWVCGLRRELGSWPAVHADERYLADVKATFSPHLGDCGDWPPPGIVCESCGVSGG